MRAVARRAVAAQGLVGLVLIAVGVAFLAGWPWGLVIVGAGMLIAAATGARP